jgi:acetylornithine deacetylase/succinyl-diaminopimelate desuccinylase-like protein
LLAGIEPPAAAELASWERLPPGDRVLADVGARELYPGAGAEYYRRTGADASLDVNMIAGGADRTVVPASARATLSMRLAPRQRADEIRPLLERLLRDAAPAGAEVEITHHSGEPALFSVDEPAIRLAAAAIERACGVSPALVRIGGSIPIVAELAAKGIPTIVSGFVLPDDAFHAPNESYALRSLELGERAGRELLVQMEMIPRR